MNKNEIRATLGRKLDDAWAAYQHKILEHGPAHIFNRANEIAATEQVYHELREGGYPADLLEYLLRFENPLEVARDKWLDANNVSVDEEMTHALWDLADKGDAEQVYDLDTAFPATPLSPGAPETSSDAAGAALRTPMDTDRFWDIIGQASLRRDDDGSIADALVRRLENLAPRDILQWGKTFDHYHHLADKWLLWSAGNLFTGGLSDDGFIDFRSWLVGSGRETYFSVLRNPDMLAALDNKPMPLDERAKYAAARAFDNIQMPGGPSYYDAYDTVLLPWEAMQAMENSIDYHPHIDKRVECIEDAQAYLPSCHEKYWQPGYAYDTWTHPVETEYRDFELT